MVAAIQCFRSCIVVAAIQCFRSCIVVAAMQSVLEVV